ncbi:hypothetical protein DPMN_128311 [Dreissena polymorpha]|uniref:Uncharacterized protein n=1 Tax=Dreissena polymorpha TaxID=45954 RepID=A0A9D4H3M7_DREPO|nr:hypothetical protein DPMN_128311 [Dreissena polymorpha]
MPFIEQLKNDFNNSGLGQRIKFGILLVLNFGNLLSDWLVYCSYALVEEGLVVGPYENNTIIKEMFLIFTAISSFTVFPEVCLDWAEIIMDKKKDNIFAGLRAAIIIVTDMPLMMMNTVMRICTEKDNTYYQMAKAIVIVIGALIRFLLTGIKIRVKQKKGIKHRKMIGLHCRVCVEQVQFTFAIVLFILSQTKQNNHGGTEFQVPHALYAKNDDSKYFTNVSIFFSHPYLDYKSNYAAHDINLIRLLSIYKLKNSMTEQTVNIHYDSNHTNFLVKISGESDQCFKKMKIQ